MFLRRVLNFCQAGRCSFCLALRCKVASVELRTLSASFEFIPFQCRHPLTPPLWRLCPSPCPISTLNNPLSCCSSTNQHFSASFYILLCQKSCLFAYYWSVGVYLHHSAVRCLTVPCCILSDGECKLCLMALFVSFGSRSFFHETAFVIRASNRSPYHAAYVTITASVFLCSPHWRLVCVKHKKRRSVIRSRKCTSSAGFLFLC